MTYSDFITSKAVVDVPTGFTPRGWPLTRPLFDFQKDIVTWACRRGRAALFEDCGLGKTAQQLAWANEVTVHTGGPVIILAPLAVAEQTVAEGLAMGIPVKHVSEQSEVGDAGIYITNYQKLHRFNCEDFVGVVLDESSILKSFDGVTRKAITTGFESTPYKLACTATPAPNDYMELGTHAEFLGVMTREEMLAMFFTHDGGDTSQWRLKGHAVDDFWHWLCTWAVNIKRPSDIGYDDAGFILPKLITNERVVGSNQKMDGYLFALPASSLEERRDARRSSLNERVDAAAEIANCSNEQFVVWCNLNSESEALTDEIDDAVEIAGKHDDEYKVNAIRKFLAGEIRVLVTKPSMFGFGLNLQCCHRQIFVGLSDSYEQFYQAVRRCWRFGQKEVVHVDIVVAETEGAVLANIRRKEADAEAMSRAMVKHMAKISSDEIHGSHRNVTHYKPKQEMVIPNWL